MLFNSFEFVIFLTIVVGSLIFLKTKRLQTIFLILASYIFYSFDAGFFFILLIFSSLLDFYCGKWIYEDPKRKRFYLYCSLIGNLSLLGIFKYADFFIENINILLSAAGISQLGYLNLLLPIGISFYTFQTMSYTIDIYRNTLKPAESFTEFALYVAFFPQLVAGPIVRAADFLPQLKEKISITYANLKLGLTHIGWGIVKKVVFADNLAPFVGTVFSSPEQFGSIEIFLAAIGFTVQIYCDFSAYTDIAIGAARMMGFVLPENFNKPYFAKNPSDFWRRWHISLSTWVNDYIFTPLFFHVQKWRMIKILNSPQLRMYVAFVISTALATFLLGLWHGAAWNFVMFGIWQGGFLILYHLTKKQWDKLNIWLQRLLTYYSTILGFTIFRQSDISSMGFMLKKMLFIHSSFQLSAVIAFVWQHQMTLFLIVLFFIIHALSKFKQDTIHWINRFSMSSWFLFLVLVVFLLFMFTPSFSTEFIYFQF